MRVPVVPSALGMPTHVDPGHPVKPQVFSPPCQGPAPYFLQHPLPPLKF